MAKNKRSLEGENATELDDVHPSRKKRLKYTEEDAALADIYNKLADEVQPVRIKAAGDLLKKLTTKSFDQAQRLETAETRLIKGLCSGRKGARLGFSIALTEVFRLNFNSKPGAEGNSVNLAATVDEIVKLTTPEGNVSGQEKRDHYLGRRFAFHALLQSDVGLKTRLSDDQWQNFLRSVFELASQKQWLRRECGAMVHEYLTTSNASKLNKSRIRTIIDELVNANLAKTSEGVGIWIAVQQHFPQVKLPKAVWNHKDPLSSRELPLLSKIVLESSVDDEPTAKKSGARQSTPSFVWTVILSQLYERGDHEDFAKFWESAVASTMFSSSSSAERKALGLQVLSLAISTAPKPMLSYVLRSQNITKCILDQRSSPERYLFDAAKVPLNQMAIRAKHEPELASVLICALLGDAPPNFDQLTKSKTVYSIIREASGKAMEEIVSFIQSRIEMTGRDQNGAENYRRMLADLLLNAIRVHRQSDNLFHSESDHAEPKHLAPWARMLLGYLVFFGYERQDPYLKNPMFSEASQAMFRNRLMSCLGCLLDHTMEKAVIGPLHVINVLSTISQLRKDLSEEERAVVGLATNIANQAVKGGSDEGTMRAFQLIFSLCIIQVYNEEPDSLAVLEDLVPCYQSLGNSGESSTMLVELLLGFISKPSALFRKLAEQVFSVFATQLTAESLQSLAIILGQKETLSGQQALFDRHEDSDDRKSSPESDDVSEIDVEDASDVELLNGHQASASDEGTDEENDSPSESPPEAEGGTTAEEDEEVAAFDKKLADALGTTGLEDSDDDGSDMDDEQMMALEPHLASIFKEQQKNASKKHENKDAKENIVNFKNRVLDLLMIYVKSQYSNILALDLILPLTTLVRTTTSKPTREKAFRVLKQYYEACSKNKVLPQPHDHEACFEVLRAVHEEMKLGGSKLHANACSRASLFLSKVLVALDQKHYERIAGMYAKLQSDWYLNEKSKVPSSVFTEWTSWSISTRKHM